MPFLSRFNFNITKVCSFFFVPQYFDLSKMCYGCSQLLFSSVGYQIISFAFPFIACVCRGSHKLAWLILRLSQRIS